MILLATDYSSTAELTAAIDTYLSNAADIYVTKATYDISRGCDQTDFFVNVLHHQVKNGYQDNVQFSGFEDYVTPAPSHVVTYLDGFNTTYGTSPATYTEGVELTITVISSNPAVQLVNVDITLTFGTEVFTVTANAQGTTTFTFTPTTQGSVTVTSALSSAASNAIAAGFHGEVVDTAVYSLASAGQYGLSLSAGNIAVGDINADGIVSTQGDVLNVLNGFGADRRLLFSKHATVELGSLFYNPGVGGTLNYTIRPVGENYNWGNSTLNNGQAKGIDDLKYTLIVVDSDGIPAVGANNLGQTSITHATNTLAADGSATGSIAISSEFNNPLLAVFALRNAYNNATLSSVSLTGLTASLSTSTFEPGNNIIVSVTDDGALLANVAGSLLYLQAFNNSTTIGAPLATTQAVVAADNTATLTLNVPSSIDQNLYLKAGYSFYTVNNAVTVANNPDSALDIASILTVTSDVAYYTAGDEVITLTVAMLGEEVRGDYNLSLYAADALEGGQNVYTVTTPDAAGTSYTFTPTSGNLDGSESIVVTVALATA